MIRSHEYNEAKALLRVHTESLFKWAAAPSACTCVSAELKEALLTVSARIHEIIEGLPQEATKTPKVN